MTDVAGVAARFALPGPVTLIEGHRRGHINESHVLSVETSTGPRRFLLQHLNPTVFPDPDAIMANIAVVTDHLRSKGEVTLAILPTEEDALCWGGWRVYELIERARPATVASDEDAAALGRCFARFHLALADLDPSRLLVTLPAFHAPARRLRDLEVAARAAGTHDAEAEVAAIRDLRPLLLRATALSAGPIRATHNDAKADNVLVDEDTGRPLAVVDLDTVMPGGLPWDVGDLVRSTTATTAEDEPGGMAFDVGRFEAVLGGYLAVAGEILTDVELTAILDAGPVITYEQAARFLTDHLRGDVYYRTAFRGQNLQRTRAQLALLGSMLDQEDDSTAVVERAGSR